MKRSSELQGRLLALVGLGLMGLIGLGWWAFATDGPLEAQALGAGGRVEILGLAGRKRGLALPAVGDAAGQAARRPERAEVAAPRPLRLPRPRVRFTASYAQPQPLPSEAQRAAQLNELFEMDADQIHDPEFHTAFMRGMLAMEADRKAALVQLQARGSTKAWLYAALKTPAADVIALKLDPGQREVMGRLLRRDAAAAVLLIEAAVGREGFVATRGSRLNLAEAFARVERGEDSAAVLVELLDEDPKDGEAMELLVRGDPQAAESRLRLLAGGGVGPWTLTLSELLDWQDRMDERVEVLREGLRKRPGDLELVRALELTAPDLAHDSLVSAHTLIEVDAELAEEFLTLAGLHALAGDRARQVEAWQQATLRSPLNDTGTVSWPKGFEKQAPGRLIQALEMRWTADASLDFLGQLGSVYWRNGYKLEAKSLWRSAKVSFPDEEAWQENLDAAEAGRAPPWFWR